MGIFTTAEARVWAPKQKLPPSTWSESNIVVSETAANPGAYKFLRTPYWREIIDLFQDKYIEEIIILKAGQIGYSQLIKNILGWAVDIAPGPMMVVMPTGDMLLKLVNEDVKGLIASCPTVQSHSPIVTKQRAKFDSMEVAFAKAGSPASLSSRAIRYLIGDEVDKWPPRCGNEGNPVDLARTRTRTFQHNKKILLGSTPSTKDRHIYKEYSLCEVKLHFFIPCPHCGGYQDLVFPHVRWEIPGHIEETPAKAEYLRNHPEAVQYVCDHCGCLFSNEQKNAAMVKGVWLSQHQRVVNGKIVGKRPKARRIGLQISALYSPWMTFAEIAAEFLLACGDTEKMMKFRNDVLAEFFEEEVQKLDSQDLEKADNAPSQWSIPNWASYLIATADCHGLGKGLYYTLRAWGYGERSQLVSAGVVDSFDELRKITLDNSFAVEGKDERIWTEALYIDSGFRTDEVYAFAQTDPDRIFPIKGASVPSYMVSRSTPKEYPGVTLMQFDTQWSKSKLADYRKRGLQQWAICQLPDQVLKPYLRHMCAEHQVVTKSGKLMWQQISKGMANHFLDCEVYQVVAAIVIHHVDQLPPPSPEAPRSATPAQPNSSQPTRQAPSGYITNTPNKWLHSHHHR